MQSYSVTITCSRMVSWSHDPHGLLTPKGFKLQIHFSMDVLFIGCDIFPRVMVISLHLIKYTLIGFNTYQWHF